MIHPLDFSRRSEPGEPDPTSDLMELEGLTFPEAVEKLCRAMLKAAADPDLAWLDLANAGGRADG